ncbi:ABC transporter ATP-binding protein [Priestia megaterium]|uniref:ABC transporter ATP-binding protein n=1 Tax=Priestia megaterium TaxID=1404 RepID=UPI002E242BA8|nr:ABC transporter ATP-binding protein [Priestia megaterium]
MMKLNRADIKRYFDKEEMISAFSIVYPLLRKHWKAYAGLMLFLLTDILITLASAWFLGDLSDAAVQGDFTRVKHLLPLAFGLILISFLTIYYDTYIEAVATSSIKRDLKEQLLRQLLLSPVHKIHTTHSGEFISHFTNDINSIDGMIGRNLINLIKLPLLFIAIFLYLAHISLLLSFVGLFIIPIAVIAGGVFGFLLRNSSREILKLNSEMTSSLSEIFQGFIVIRSFLLERSFFSKYRQQNQQALALDLYNGKMKGLFYAGGEAIALIAFLVTLCFGALIVSKGMLTVGSLLAFVSLSNRLIYPLNGLAGQWAAFQRSISAVERIAHILKAQYETTDFPEFSQKKPKQKTIYFQDMTFSYDGERYIFEHFNLQIPAGKSIAIVGASGAGKSTLFNLLQGFYQPQAGEIYIDQTPLSALTASELQNLIAYVPQETFLFTGTIRENLLLANPQTTEEELVTTARAAHIHDFILSLPHGYETKIGEKGVTLSGGQKQRIAIARAILKNAPILLLDEATSALDNETEYLVKEALQGIMKNRTTIVIAHRLSTIQNVDSIIVIDNGKLIQSGKHEELIHQPGLYRDLANVNTSQLSNNEERAIML